MTYRATVQPRGQDRNTRSKGIDDGTKIREGGQAIRTVSGANSEHSRLRGRRDIAGILSLVTGSDGHEDTGGDGVRSSGVESRRTCAT